MTTCAMHLSLLLVASPLYSLSSVFPVQLDMASQGSTDQENVTYLAANLMALETFMQDLLTLKPQDLSQALHVAIGAIRTHLYGTTSPARRVQVRRGRGPGHSAHPSQAQEEEIQTGDALLDRAADGLLELRVEKAELYPAGWHPAASFDESMSDIDLGDVEDYRHCPICGRSTSERIADHIRSAHPDADVAEHEHDNHERPSWKLLLRLALQKKEVLARAEDIPRVPPDGLCALYLYTMETPIYKVVNLALRNNDQAVIAHWRAFIYHAVAGLSALPPYKGLVYRGVNVQVPVDIYAAGKVVIWQSFSSATTNAIVARDFLLANSDDSSDVKQAGSLFVIDSQRSSNVSPFSAIPSEDEVVFPPNSVFRSMGMLSHRHMQMVGATMQLDMTHISVYEVVEVNLETFKGVREAMTDSERDGLTAVTNLLDGAIRSGSNSGRFVGTLKDETGLTLLHHTVKYGSVPMLNVLLAAGHPVNVKDAVGSTPLDYCYLLEIAALLDPSLGLTEVASSIQLLEPKPSPVARKVYSIHGRSSTPVTRGNYYFEVRYLRGDAVAIGWCLPSWSPPPGEGCGDDPKSWGWACHGGYLHQNVSACHMDGVGPKWQKGDVIGCLVQIDTASHKVQLQWSHNGSIQMGHKAAPILELDAQMLLSEGLCACVTMFRSGDVEIALTEEQLRHLPSGYSPLPMPKRS